MSEQPIKLRAALPEDRAFILSSWLESYRQSHWGEKLTNTVYFSEHRRTIQELLKRAKITVAVSGDDSHQIFGWICAETHLPIPIVHYLYIKLPYRRFGIGKMLFSLLDAGPFLYTHEMNNWAYFGKEGVYSPYALFLTLGE